jgi:hypothetical protein
VAGYQTACTNGLLAVLLLQWLDTKLHARVVALLQWQVLKLLNWVLAGKNALREHTSVFYYATLVTLSLGCNNDMRRGPIPDFSAGPLVGFCIIGESSLDLPNGLKHLLCELGGARAR